MRRAREALIAGWLASALVASSARAAAVRVLPLDGAITPISAEYLVQGIERAERDGARAVVIELDTPGGLADSMRRIVKAQLNAGIPVVVYVAPAGSHAASAGVFITMAAHVAVMAPGTNIGSASVVSIGGAGMDSVMAKKVNNDAVAYLEGIATQRHRNAAWAARFVLHAENVPAQRAVQEHIVDFMAASFAALLDSLQGRTVQLSQGPVTLDLKDAPVERVGMGLRQRLLSVLVDPNVAYILMLLGVYGLFFELSNPGAVVPGVLGGICILLAFFAFQSLPTNYAGIALILLGILLLILEVKVTSFGLLTMGGLTALVLGSLILFDTAQAWARVSWRVIAPMVLVSAGFFITCVWLGVRGHRRPVSTGRSAMIGNMGRVVTPLGGADAPGKVVFHGEMWDALADSPLPTGTRVEVVGFDGRVARVRPCAESGRGAV
jgi:membrane-bound serine protease (ClpP class)